MPLQLIRQDITQIRADAIVHLTPEAVSPGQATITKGERANASYTIRTTGPTWQGDLAEESKTLKSCYVESLKLAVAHGCASVAFPLISSDAYGCPKELVLKFAIQIITEFLLENELKVYLCVANPASYLFNKEIFDTIQEAIDAAKAREQERDRICIVRHCCDDSVRPIEPRANKTLQEYVRSKDKSFAQKLFDWIDARGMTDVECYKKANVDKKTFSKIKCHPDTYRPSKQTAVAFAIALRLNVRETQELLASAGLTLSNAFVFDIIILYFIQNGIYDVFAINEALFEFDQVLLGC